MPEADRDLHAVIVTFKVKPEHGAAFRGAVLENARLSLDLEPGCHVFDVCEATAGAEFVLYELYDDAAAFDAHLRTDHFRSFDEGSRSWIAEKAVVRAERLTQSARSGR